MECILIIFMLLVPLTIFAQETSSSPHEIHDKTGNYLCTTTKRSQYRFDEFYKTDLKRMGEFEDKISKIDEKRQSWIDVYKITKSGDRRLYSISYPNIKNLGEFANIGEFEYLATDDVRKIWYFSWTDSIIRSSNNDISLFYCKLDQSKIEYVGYFYGSMLTVNVSPSGRYLLLHSGQHASVDCCMLLLLVDINKNKMTTIYNPNGIDDATDARWIDNNTLQLFQQNDQGNGLNCDIILRNINVSDQTLTWKDVYD
jgi:hypothetical protein